MLFPLDHHSFCSSWQPYGWKLCHPSLRKALTQPPELSPARWNSLRCCLSFGSVSSLKFQAATSSLKTPIQLDSFFCFPSRGIGKVVPKESGSTAAQLPFPSGSPNPVQNTPFFLEIPTPPTEMGQSD